MGRHNVNITFPSERYVVVSDGFSTFFIVETGDRSVNESTSWKIVHEQKEIQEHSIHKLGQFTLLDSKMYKSSTHEVFLDILLLRLQNKSDTDISEFLDKHDGEFLAMSANHPFVSKINWLTFKEDAGKWSSDCSRTLLGPSALDYACLEREGSAVLIASENHFAFYHVSNEPLRYTKKSKNVKGTEVEKPDYVWMQNNTEITILFKIPIGARKTDITVDVKPSSICLVYGGTPMLEGELLQNVKSDESVWTINPHSVIDEDNTEDSEPFVSGNLSTLQSQYQSLEIILQKASEVRWEGESVVKGVSSSSQGQQVLDPEAVANIQERLNHLCSDKWNDDPLRTNICDPQQLEDCDCLPADTTSFMRLDKNLQCISHVASLGGHQWLFSARVHGSSIPAMCIRHDVDGLLWQPPEVDNNLLDSWTLEHVGTFSAMGYVQASKQQRKFTACPPDLSYLAICDASKHVYIYRQPHEIGSDLRNRKTGQIISHVSKQHVVSLEPPLEILGAHATDDFLFVLTTQNVHAIRVKEVVDE
ncbi:nudC domain-containing protein 1 isoform X2 [Folsomia candida]|nr:nudC domain-containing protein 1 isoform X2 [Folsomia candida]